VSSINGDELHRVDPFGDHPQTLGCGAHSDSRTAALRAFLGARVRAGPAAVEGRAGATSNAGHALFRAHRRTQRAADGGRRGSHSSSRVEDLLDDARDVGLDMHVSLPRVGVGYAIPACAKRDGRGDSALLTRLEDSDLLVVAAIIVM
jgi:hypothetical protein